jgi:AcrR family transcriptional regulator
MAAPTRTPRSTWIEQGLQALATGGPDAVRIEVLAQQLGVSKGGFYGHFDSRSALLEEMLDTWERVVIDEVIEHIERQGGDAKAKLKRLFGLARAYSKQGLLAIEPPIRAWARRDKAVAARLRRVDNRRMQYLRTLFGEFCRDQDDIEARCLLAMALFVANHLIAADHPAHNRTDVVKLAVRLLLS